MRKGGEELKANWKCFHAIFKFLLISNIYYFKENGVFLPTGLDFMVFTSPVYTEAGPSDTRSGAGKSRNGAIDWLVDIGV